jgi:hypothetical protein
MPLQIKRLPILILVAAITIVAVWMLFNGSTKPGSILRSTGSITVVSATPAETVPTAATSSATLPLIPDTSPVPTATEQQIASTIGVSPSTLHKVKLADAQGTVACGERTVEGAAYARKFVWMKEAGLLATDDGGPDFANLAKVCGK